MVKILNFSDNDLMQIMRHVCNNNGYESTTHFYELDGEKKIIKLFKPDIDIDNKIKKMNLIKERTKKIDFLVTADFYVKNGNCIIGYGMPYICGKEYDYSIGTNKKENILILKQLATKLRVLHNLGIVYSDSSHNFLIQDDGEIKLIDHDNVKIDNLDVDSKTIILKKYVEKTKTFDKRFDNYELNLLTLSTLSSINFLHLSLGGYRAFKMKLKDDEINNIIFNTFNLDGQYNEDLIVDKINNKKDFKKIRHRFL